jgi:hypothetical protein
MHVRNSSASRCADRSLCEHLCDMLVYHQEAQVRGEVLLDMKHTAASSSATATTAAAGDKAKGKAKPAAAATKKAAGKGKAKAKVYTHTRMHLDFPVNES